MNRLDLWMVRFRQKNSSEIATPHGVPSVVLKLAVIGISFAFIAWVLPGIEIQGLLPLIVASVVLAFLNVVLKPIFILLTLPLNLVTLGTFTLVINGLLIYLTSKIVEGFFVASFFSAVVGAVLFSLVSLLLNFSLDNRFDFRLIHHR